MIQEVSLLCHSSGLQFGLSDSCIQVHEIEKRPLAAKCHPSVVWSSMHCVISVGTWIGSKERCGSIHCLRWCVIARIMDGLVLIDVRKERKSGISCMLAASLPGH
jgi:hypothetical protein